MVALNMNAAMAKNLAGFCQLNFCGPLLNKCRAVFAACPGHSNIVCAGRLCDRLYEANVFHHLSVLVTVLGPLALLKACMTVLLGRF
jgi:hypothetical protein